MDTIPCIIPPTQDAATFVLRTAMPGRVGCLSVVGTLVDEEIAVQKPLVANPDADTDAHWGQLSLNDEDLVLRSGHDAEPIPISMVVRISKPITANEVGVAWS